MFQYTICAFLAPAVASAMAFPWALPEPTLVIPEQDNWSPAPTAAPNMGVMDLFRRAEGDNTCGYIDGVSSMLPTPPSRDYTDRTSTILDLQQR